MASTTVTFDVLHRHLLQLSLRLDDLAEGIQTIQETLNDIQWQDGDTDADVSAGSGSDTDPLEDVDMFDGGGFTSAAALVKRRKPAE